MDTSFYLKSYTFFSLNLEMMFGKVTGDKAIAPSTDHMVHPTFCLWRALSSSQKVLFSLNISR